MEPEEGSNAELLPLCRLMFSAPSPEMTKWNRCSIMTETARFNDVPAGVSETWRSTNSWQMTQSWLLHLSNSNKWSVRHCDCKTRRAHKLWDLGRRCAGQFLSEMRLRFLSLNAIVDVRRRRRRHEMTFRISRKLLKLATSKTAWESLHFHLKWCHQLLPVSSKSHKRFHFGTSLGRDFSMRVQPILKSYSFGNCDSRTSVRLL